MMIEYIADTIEINVVIIYTTGNSMLIQYFGK